MIRILSRSLLALATVLVACSAAKNNGADGLSTPPGVDPGPTSFKKLNYLYSISGKKTIAGIHNREPNATPARWTEEVFTTTGKYPGLWSGDFLFQAENIDNRGVMIKEALAQWKKGSLINIMWHACNPALSQPCGWDNQGVKSKLTDAQFTELITDGTTLNTRWKAMMDEVAVHLSFLQQNGVEVLWRPLHEMNQGVFWWGGRPGPTGTRKLWQITHDYLVKKKGLTNLVWVWDIQDFKTLATDAEAYNPGNDYWDVAALDVYDDGSGYSQQKYDIMVKASGGKPIAIGECQKYPTAEQLASQPKWTFFMGWSELVFSNNSKEQLQKLMTANNTVTLDQMPGWK
jgi:mannan endo-1,4-beta-mannosidase